MWTGSHVNASSQKPQEALPRHATRRLARLESSEDPPPPREERSVERMRTPRWAGHFPPLPTAPTPPYTPVAGNKARGRTTVAPQPGSGTRGLRHTQFPRAPPSLFGWPGAERPPSVTPRRRAPGTCLGSRVPRTAAAGSPRSPQPALPAPRPRSRPWGAGPPPPTRHTRLAPASRAALLLAATACSSCEHTRPNPEAPVPAPTRPPSLPSRPGTPRLRRARGRFSPCTLR